MMLEHWRWTWWNSMWQWGDYNPRLIIYCYWLLASAKTHRCCEGKGQHCGKHNDQGRLIWCAKSGVSISDQLAEAASLTKYVKALFAMTAVITEGSGILMMSSETEQSTVWLHNVIRLYVPKKLWHRNKWAKQVIALGSEVTWLVDIGNGSLCEVCWSLPVLLYTKDFIVVMGSTIGYYLSTSRCYSEML